MSLRTLFKPRWIRLYVLIKLGGQGISLKSTRRSHLKWQTMTGYLRIDKLAAYRNENPSAIPGTEGTASNYFYAYRADSTLSKLSSGSCSG